MEVEKLIEAIRLCGSAPKVEQCRKCSYWSDGNMSKCIPKMTEDAATVIQYLDEGAQEVNKALQEQIAENEKLRAELEKESAARKRQADILCELRGQKYEQISAIDYLRVELKQKEKLVNQQANELERRDKLLKEQEAELEQAKRERDAAIKEIFQWTGCPACKHWDSSEYWCNKHDRSADVADGCSSPEWRGPEKRGF